MLLSSGDERKRGSARDETGENWCWFRTLAARDAAGGNDRARRGTRRRLGPRFLLALRPSARAIAGARRRRDAIAPRLAHVAHETRAERTAAQPAPPADGREIVRLARLPLARPHGDGGRPRRSPR